MTGPVARAAARLLAAGPDPGVSAASRGRRTGAGPGAAGDRDPHPHQLSLKLRISRRSGAGLLLDIGQAQGLQQLRGAVVALALGRLLTRPARGGVASLSSRMASRAARSTGNSSRVSSRASSLRSSIASWSESASVPSNSSRGSSSGSASRHSSVWSGCGVPRGVGLGLVRQFFHAVARAWCFRAPYTPPALSLMSAGCGVCGLRVSRRAVWAPPAQRGELE